MAWNLSALLRRPAEGTNRPRRLSARPALEGLEDRYCLSFGVTFYIDPTQSSLAVTGHVGGGALQQQGAGSLSTTYEGVVHTSLADDESSIQFLTDTTNVTADNSGNWSPAVGGGSGSAPANYGARATVIIVTAQVAIRDLAVTVSSDVLSMPDGVTFDSSQQTLATTGGSADYNAGSFGSGRSSVAGQSTANQATPSYFFDNGDGTFALYNYVHFTISGTASGIAYDFTADGQVVAYGVADGFAPPRTAPGRGHDAQAFLVGSPALTGLAAPTLAPTGLASGLGGNAQALGVDPAVAGLTGPAALHQGVSPTGTFGHALTNTDATDHALSLVLSGGLHTDLAVDLAASALAS